MRMKQVSSSQISRIGYEIATKTLAVEFHPRKDETVGAVYHYDNVSAEDHAALMSAKSIGSHFGKHIRSDPAKYPYRKV
ncbi:MAG TPA: KTSC domain-containing protein [Bradyrhizobium sp.]|nr:KTSC domain-containing protein [Bradyrhizobium sp.]